MALPSQPSTSGCGTWACGAPVVGALHGGGTIVASWKLARWAERLWQLATLSFILKKPVQHLRKMLKTLPARARSLGLTTFGQVQVPVTLAQKDLFLEVAGAA